MPTSSSMPAHHLNNSVIHLCHKIREKMSGCVTPKEGHARIVAEIEQLMMMIAFITFKSSLVPLFEGL